MALLVYGWNASKKGTQIHGGNKAHGLDLASNGRVSEPLAFLRLPLLAALTSATLVGGI